MPDPDRLPTDKQRGLVIVQTDRTSAAQPALRADLAADDALCELAVFHEPAFATHASHGPNTKMRTPW